MTREKSSLHIRIILLVLVAIILCTQSIVFHDVTASHNANLFVSAENAQFNNYFAGPQVIEVVVNDNDIKTLDDVHGEPDVTVNGKKLRMVQTTDGNWYGYFASKTQAQGADNTVGLAGKGLDFGEFCASTSTSLGVSYTETVGVAIANDDTEATNGNVTFVDCNTVGVSAVRVNHVVRENKMLNTATGNLGQIGVATDTWPVIQLYDFKVGGNVVIQYNKGGGVQTTMLTFDMIPSNLITTTLDRTNYPQSSEIHVSIADPQLNIDPTDEDSWTWDTYSLNNRVFYQAFDENGISDTNGGIGMQDLQARLTTLMFEKNGRLTVDPAAQGTVVTTLGDNNKEEFPPIDAAAIPFLTGITFTEISSNSGIFGNYDELDNANFDITANAERGRSATITYNGVSHSIVVGFGFGTIDINVPDGEWNSGEEVGVTLVDSDANKNSKVDEDLDLFRSSVTIPALQIGSPVTLQYASGVKFYSDSTVPLAAGTSIPSEVTEGFSDILSVDTISIPSGPFEKITLNLGITAANLQSLFIDKTHPNTNGFNFINYDFRSLEQQLQISSSSFSDTSMTLHFGSLPGATTVQIVDLVDISTSKGLVKVDDSDITTINSISSSSQVFLEINFDTSGDTTNAGMVSSETDVQRIAFDLFSFGAVDGAGINNAIYRFELEETGDNTSTFVGSAEFTMLNQLNIFEESTYTNLRTIDDQIRFVVHENLVNEDAPRINYHDLGGDGVFTPISDQQNTPTHSGRVSFDKDGYGFGETVTVTLEDADLNVESDLVDIYTTPEPNLPTDPAYDTIGKDGLGTYSNENPFGVLLEITFADFRWETSTGTCTVTNADTGLKDSGFTLIETGTRTGVFMGSFQIPQDFCPHANEEPEATKGKDVKVNYFDFRDAVGKISEFNDVACVGDCAGPVEELEQPFGFSISAEQISTPIIPGKSYKSNIEVKLESGTPQPVSLSCRIDSVGGGICKVHPTEITPPDSVSITYSTKQESKFFDVLIIGTSGTIRHEKTISVPIKIEPLNEPTRSPPIPPEVYYAAGGAAAAAVAVIALTFTSAPPPSISPPPNAAFTIRLDPPKVEFIGR